MNKERGNNAFRKLIPRPSTTGNELDRWKVESRPNWAARALLDGHESYRIFESRSFLNILGTAVCKKLPGGLGGLRKRSSERIRKGQPPNVRAPMDV